MSQWLYRKSQFPSTENRNFFRPKNRKNIFKISKDFRVLIFGLPGTPIHEIGNRFAEKFDLDLIEITRSYEDEEDYFDDKIPELTFDTGDLLSGSESQQMVRDPSAEEYQKSIDEAKIPVADDEPLSDQERIELFSYESGVIVTELGEPDLVKWAESSSGNFGIFYLEANEKKAINWFQHVRKCKTCGAVYHLEERPPIVNGVCDRCGSYDLMAKPENHPKEIRKQYNLWKKEFAPMEKMAKMTGQLFSIDMDDYRSIDSMIRDMVKYIKSEDKSPKGNKITKIRPEKK